jgi:hypothetical protein
VAPLVELGSDHDVVTATVFTLIDSVFGLVIAFGHGLTTRESARVCPLQTIGAVVGSLNGVS